MITKYYNKIVKIIKRRHALASEKNALAPLNNKLESSDFGAAQVVLNDPNFRGRLASVGVEEQRLVELFSCLPPSASGRSVILRPHNFTGHLTHFHHYFGGVLLPLLEWCSVGLLSKGDSVLVRDCGPMNAELAQWSEILALRCASVPSSVIQALETSQSIDKWDAPGYDFSFREDWYPRKLVVERIRDHVFRCLGEMKVEQPETRPEIPKIVLIARGKPDPFYKSRKADTKTAGAQRRSMPNIQDLYERLTTLSSEVVIAYLEEMRVQDKVVLFKNADLVIGQMGAGLNNALWMRPGSAMIEILSLDSIRPNFAVFANICHRMDVRHRRVVQESNHAPVNLDLITGFAKDLLATAPTC
jgi:hypothetical protein